MGMRKAETGTWGSKNCHRRTQTHTDTNYIKGVNVCVWLCESVANHINDCGMFRFGILDCGFKVCCHLSSHTDKLIN
jgi:hypothetical protein